MLSDVARGRDNNFNIIRICAALAVLVTHSFALVVGSGNAEPLRNTLGMTLGYIAVDIFFITSGFLVTASLLSRQSTLEFIWARVLRIYPALIVMLLFTVLVLGPVFTALPISQYFASKITVKYFVKCATLLFGVVYDLPGVFVDNPYKGAVNGSLWTMPSEIKMYLFLAGAWLILGLVRAVRLPAFKWAVIIAASAAGVYVVVSEFCVSSPSYFIRLFFMFFTGASFYILKNRIPVSRVPFAVLFAALLLSVVNKQFFFVVYMCSLAYILFFIAYVPKGIIRQYNRLGDYSYGIYIYAFPVQQSIIACIPGISIFQMIVLSAAITLVFSVLSWHILEKRALTLKSFYVGHTRKLFAGQRSVI